METKRIEVKREVAPNVLLNKSRYDAVQEAAASAWSELREQAVLANADGWQSGPMEYSICERGWDLVLEVTVYMDMTREVEVND